MVRGAVCVPDAGKALGLGLNHRLKVVPSVGTLLLQVDADGGEVFVAEGFFQQLAIGGRAFDGVGSQGKLRGATSCRASADGESRGRNTPYYRAGSEPDPLPAGVLCLYAHRSRITQCGQSGLRALQT